MNRPNPNPFDGPLFVVTHRTEDAPDPSTGFHFVDGLEAAMQRAAGRDVSISGGADVIRQVARLAEIPAPVSPASTSARVAALVRQPQIGRVVRSTIGDADDMIERQRGTVMAEIGDRVSDRRGVGRPGDP
jgi:hypothetical protein